MRKLIITLILLGFIVHAQAQHSISGSVVDEDQMPLFGVDVYIEQLHIGTSSDENGNFILNNVPKGNHKVSFSFVGYETLNQDLRITESVEGIHVELTPSVFHMDEVIVSAPFSRLQSENVLKIESKPIEALQKAGGATLMQGISQIPGVAELSTGNGIGKPVIRGLSGNRVLVYTQGVRLENQQFGDEHGLGLAGAGVESVEVIKGPASLLYGSDALGGVLYFNPERFANQGETKVSIGQNFFSNTLGSNTTAGVKTSKGSFKFLARGTYNSHSDYEVPNGDRVTNTRYNEKDFKTGLGFNLKNFVTEIRYNYNASEVGIPEGIEDQSKSKSVQVPYQDLSTHIVSAHNHIYLDKSRFDLNLGYIQNNRLEYEDEHGHEGEQEIHESEEEIHEGEEEHAEAALDMDLKTFTYELKYHLPKSEKFESILGIQGMYQDNKNHGEETLIPDAVTKDFGLLYNATYSFNQNHVIQGGLRYDQRNINTSAYEIVEHGHEEGAGHEEDEVITVPALDRSFGNASFSLGYKTRLFDMLITRINLASGFRAPNLGELTSFGVHHGTNRFEIGNPDLKSERNYQTDVSVEYSDRHFEAYANGFYNSMNNYIYVEPTGEVIEDSAVFEYVQNDARLYGTELGLHLHPHRIHWFHLESAFQMVIGELNSGEDLPLIPANIWRNTVRGEFKGNERFRELYAAVSLDSFFDQNKVSGFETPTEGYNLLHLRFGGTISFQKADMKVNLSLNNILDEAYISHLSRLKVDAIPNQGRNIVLGLNFRI